MADLSTNAESCSWCGRLMSNHMHAYYFALDETDSASVNRILCSLAYAGKRFHHTQEWDDDETHGTSCIDLIQRAANDAATEIRTLRKENERLRAWLLRGVKDAFDSGGSIESPALTGLECQQALDGEDPSR